MNKKKIITDEDIDRACANFLDALTDRFDDEMDPDGKCYEAALKYMKENNIDTKSLDSILQTSHDVNLKQEALFKHLDENLSDEERKQTDELLSKYSDISCGLMSMILEARKTKYTA